MSAPESKSSAEIFELTEEGSVVRNKKGKSTVLASYDEDTGRLEFENEKIDADYRPQVIRAITEDSEGNLSGRKINAFAIKGREEDTPKAKEPPQPLPTKHLGDKTPAVVDWYFKWRPQEAYARYGVVLDGSGEPVRVHGRRVERTIGEDKNTGLVQQFENVIESESGILARRGTHLTFTREEIVGASNAGDYADDYADSPAKGGR